MKVGPPGSPCRGQAPNHRMLRWLKTVVEGNELHVRITPLSAPRRTRAIAGLCAHFPEIQTSYPGTDLRLVYSVKEP
ncbi:MAG: hypothetical protein ACYDGN_04565 [Acidimicrobiales bacterium]